MFQIVALPFDALQALPPLEFKLMAALLRYANKAGECWPVLRQLAADIGKSEATVCRAMQRLANTFNAFTERCRPGNGRYRYKIAERFLPRWPGRKPPPDPSCMVVQDGLAQAASQEANPAKQAREARPRDRLGFAGKTAGLPLDPASQWRKRIESWWRSGCKFWLAEWGDRPGQPGCLADPRLIREVIGNAI